MKILIKSVEEIEKTLDVHEEKDGILYDKCEMRMYSGKVLDTKGKKSRHGYHRADAWTWHHDWIHVLPDGYDYEKFKWLEQALVWVAEKGAILSERGYIVKDVSSFSVRDVSIDWKSWHKAIPVKAKTLQIVKYLNVYTDGDMVHNYNTKEIADFSAGINRIDCKKIELNYEFKDGKWVEV